LFSHHYVFLLGKNLTNGSFAWESECSGAWSDPTAMAKYWRFPTSAQQLYANQSPVSNSPRQQHASLGVNSHQHPSSQRNPHVHQHPSPGLNVQQMPVHWGGGAHPGQWRSTSPTQAQLNTTTPGASDHNWRPLQRMRGSVTNPALERGGPSTGPPFQPHRLPVASPVNTFPPTQPFGFNTPPANVVPPISFSFYGMDPVPILTNPAVNVSLYNGTSWVNGSEFSSAPMFGGVQTSDGWFSFENVSSGIPPGHPH
jgi:hypothetical protein